MLFTLLYGCPAPTAVSTTPSTVSQDRDGDGYDDIALGGDDCDDTDATIHPGVEEVWYDGDDSNCDGADDFDRDGDGAPPFDFGGGDCDDTDPTVLQLPGWDLLDAPCSCGNNVVEAGETCDHPSTASYTCTSCAGPCGDGIWDEATCQITVQFPSIPLFAAGDLNEDGYDDVFVAQMVFGTPGHFDLVFGGPTGPGDLLPLALTLNIDLPIAAGYLDNDGHRDVVVAYDLPSANPTTAVWWGHGDGTFTEQDLPATGDSAVIADLDADGIPDLVMTSSSFPNNHVQRVQHVGPRQFEVTTLETSSTHGYGHLAVGNFDADPELELLYQASGCGTASCFSPGPLVRRELDGAPTQLEPEVQIRAVADFDGDGCADLLIPSLDQWLSCGTVSNSLSPSFPDVGMTAVDLDHDGLDDLVPATGLEIWFNDGSGSFLTRSIPAQSADVFLGVLGDVDGNGTDDLWFGSGSMTAVLLDP